MKYIYFKTSMPTDDEKNRNLIDPYNYEYNPYGEVVPKKPKKNTDYDDDPPQTFYLGSGLCNSRVE